MAVGVVPNCVLPQGQNRIFGPSIMRHERREQSVIPPFGCRRWSLDERQNGAVRNHTSLGLGTQALNKGEGGPQRWHASNVFRIPTEIAECICIYLPVLAFVAEQLRQST